MSKKTIDNLSFEEAMNQLDSALAVLSSGDIALDEAMEQYKMGLDMVALCQQKLQTAEGEIKILQNGLEKAFEIEEL